jgi:hypothetical protein
MVVIFWYLTDQWELVMIIPSVFPFARRAVSGSPQHGPLAEHSAACFRSYCYVKYASTQDAVRAIRMLNNRTLRPGYPPLKVAWYEKPD